MLFHIASEQETGFAQILTTSSFTTKCQRGRRRQGKKGEYNRLTTLKNFQLFSRYVPQDLQNISTKDLASSNVDEDLLMTQQGGQGQLDTVADQRLLPRVGRKMKFRDTLPKHELLSQNDVYSLAQKRIKADRNILQRQLSAYEAGRKVDLPMILKHELILVHPALAGANGSVRSGSKAILF